MPVNPYSIVTSFEEAIADYCGSKYAVAVESCTAAIFLSLVYRKEEIGSLGNIEIPCHTYPGVPCSIIQAGGKVVFNNIDWGGTYELFPLGIIDGALRFKRNMYVRDANADYLSYWKGEKQFHIKHLLHCVSFHIKKLIPIGRGGAILTDDFEAVKWLRKARFDGRNPVPLLEDNFDMLGYNCYMNPPDAARGLQLLQALGDRELEDLDVSKQGYPDLSTFKIYTQ